MCADRLFNPNPQYPKDRRAGENGRDAEDRRTGLSPENGLWSADIWGVAPHKIFLWDRQGIYLDHSYPNPLFGHFLGTSALIGRKVTEVLPHPASELVLFQIQRTATQQSTGLSFIELPLKGKLYTVIIRFVPLQQFVLGLVNDFPVLNKPISHTTSMPRTTGKQTDVTNHPSLTSRECQVVCWVRKGKTNWEIGKILGIAERTVRFHMENIFCKLQVTSRMQVAAHPSQVKTHSRYSKV